MLIIVSGEIVKICYDSYDRQATIESLKELVERRQIMGEGEDAAEYLFQYLRNLLGEFVRAKRGGGHGGTIEVCEVGYNMGHSSLIWLMEDGGIRVRAFDIGEHEYSLPASRHLEERFGSGRFGITFGDSLETVPHFASLVSAGLEDPCHVVFVDGGHTPAVARSDIASFGAAVDPGGHLLIVDDTNQGGVGDVWRDMQEEGIVAEAGAVYEDVFYKDVDSSRSSISYGVYL
ncbi:hypothetical protein TrCOL_g3190 [Triparma columacea]|uniref:Uncharacterized protein n=1 Tax=Triparma columacea TaxID=722753 RepID=A0A9W7GAL7_9STRA|nr:hypothetical protein TrCOL_g3190 [Triparma columacea]